MVRPSRESLNRLAQLIREAKPVYRECSYILNNLAIGKERPAPNDGESANRHVRRNPSESARTICTTPY